MARCPDGSRRDKASGKCKKNSTPQRADVKKAAAKRAAMKKAVSAKKAAAKMAAIKRASAKKAAAKKASAKKAAAKKAAAKKAAAKKVTAKKATAKKITLKNVTVRVSKSKTVKAPRTKSLSRTAGVKFNIKKFSNPKIMCNLTHKQFLTAVKKMGSSQRKIDINKDLPTSKHPNMLCDNFKEMIDASCVKGWDITGYLGEGVYGTTYSATRKRDGKEGVVKVQTGNSGVRREIESQKVLHAKGLAPEIFEYCSYKPKKNMKMERGHTHVFVVFMGKVDGIVESWLDRPKISEESIRMLAKAIFVTLGKFQREGVTHGDFHIGNIGYVFTDSTKTKVVVAPIDFGITTTKKAHTRFELLQLSRTLSPVYSDSKHKYSLALLDKHIRQLSTSIYNYNLPSKGTIEKIHGKKHDKYIDTYFRK